MAAAEQVRGLSLAWAIVRPLEPGDAVVGAAAVRSPASTSSVFGMIRGGEPSGFSREASASASESKPTTTPAVHLVKRDPRIETSPRHRRVPCFKRSARGNCWHCLEEWGKKRTARGTAGRQPQVHYENEIVYL